MPKSQAEGCVRKTAPTLQAPKETREGMIDGEGVGSSGPNPYKKTPKHRPKGERHEAQDSNGRGVASEKKSSGAETNF